MTTPFPRRTFLAGLAALGGGALAGCSPARPTPDPSPRDMPGDGVPSADDTGAPSASAAPTASGTPTPTSTSPDAARATVPVLCYHQVREWVKSDSENNRASLICPPGRFGEHLDAIKGAGYTTITPADYLAHLTGADTLPAKPVLLSFDDGKDNQPETAFAELSRRGMTGTLYIMTVVLNKKGWISNKQVRELADAGHVIGSHTWDHQQVTKLATDEDWKTQLVDSRKTLQDLSGQSVDSFAYPYGLWSPAVLPHIAAAGYTTAFQLTDKPLDADHPALSLRRRLAMSTWSGPQAVAALASFA